MADSTSNSSLHQESDLKIDPKPTPQSSQSILKIPNRHEDRTEEKIGDHGAKRRKRPSLHSSLSFADSEHPIIDISNLDYKAYRHKLIEATLRKQYDDFQPPGDVVMNSLHLNSADSVIGVRLNDRYDHSFFDFIEEYYDAAKATSRKVSGRLHPLDHFLTRGARRPSTAEKETETTIRNEDVDWKSSEDMRNHSSKVVDNHFIKLSGMDNNGNPCVYSQILSFDDGASAIVKSDSDSKLEVSSKSLTQSCKPVVDQSKSTGHNVENDCLQSADSSTRKELSWTTRSRSASAGSASTTSKDFALFRVATSPERKRVTRLSLRKKSQECPVEFSLPNERRRGRGSESNFISSSSEIASVCSDSSKRRDDRVSRESSISPRNRGTLRPPWLLGNRDASFNRKYGNITRDSTRAARPMSARASSALSPKLAVSNRERSKEPSSASVSRNLVSPERKATSFIAPREKEFIEMSTERRKGRSLAVSSRQQRDKLKSVGNGAAKSNEKGRTSLGEGRSAKKTMISATRDDNAASFLPSQARTQVYQTRSSRAVTSADAPASAVVPQTLATKEPRLTSNERCSSSGTRRRPPSRGSTSERRCESSAVQDQRRNSARLNHGCRRRSRNAEKNPSKGAPLSPKIELSAEVLNLADDTDKSAIPDDERLAGHTLPVKPRVNAEATESDGTRAITSAENAEATKNGAISDNTDDNVARSEVPPEIIRNLRTRAASANNLLQSCKSASASHPARRDANFEARSGLNGAKLNTRSNDAVGKMRCDEFAKASHSAPRGSGKSGETKARERDIVGNSPDEELKLPRRDSKIGLVMNSALKRYIKMLKQGLLDHGDKDSVALASLSLTDAISILSEQKTSLSPGEIQELQNVLAQVERNPELIHKASLSSMDNVV